MECIYCAVPLKGFSDTRVVTIQRQRLLACADLKACEDRVHAQERRQRGEGA